MGLVNIPCGEAKPGETAPRKNARLGSQDPISRPVGYKANTVYEFMLEAFEKGGNKPGMAHRDIIEIHQETKQVKKIVDGEEQMLDKNWLYYELSDYKYETYNQVLKFVHEYGRGLVALGLNHSGVDNLHIFASTSHKWMKTFLAAQTQAIPVVTAYDTLGERGLTVSLTQTSSKAVFTDNALLQNLINPLKTATDVKFIIHSEDIDESDKRQNGELYSNAKKAVDDILKIRPDIKIVSINKVVELGKNDESITTHPPNPKDVSCIMYTSGSTGDPKGVVLTHANIVSGIAGVSFVVHRGIVNDKDRIIAFLPLAHIFELVFELIAFYWGGVVGYANVKTLSDISTRNCVGDIKAFEPTIMVGVAAVWEQLKKGILGQIAKQPSFTQKLFWAAYNYKLSSFKIPGSTFLIDHIIFKKVKAATGGRLRYSLNGGSPISKDTQQFISNLLCPLLIGYGLTETVANTTVVSPDHFEYNVQGELTGSIQVKLIDVPDAGYFAKDNQGEILIKGAPVTSHYFKMDDLTKETIVDGWFKTGDIGEWTSTGQLKIIDRKKNLVKTLNGEYIALEKLESIYRSNSYVLNICCYADENKAKPIGIIVPNEKNVLELAKELKLISGDVEDLSTVLTNKKLTSRILKSILETGKSQGLAGIELLANVVLVEEEWTPQNGFVTSAQKLQRKKILNENKDQVEKAYQEANN